MTEKIREFLQQKRWLQLKKTDWIAVALVGVLLLVVAMPSGGTGIHLAENKKAAETLIADILVQMQLPTKILAHLPRQISGGEAQRVALARCLLLRPKLLILDEATSMLDVSTQANLLALVRAQMIPSGGSVLFISHDRALTDFYCDTVYAFDEDHRLKEVRA